MPAHPHCLCRFVEVYRSKNKPKDQRAKAGREWLEKLSEQDRKRVLGKKGAEAFDKNQEWEDKNKGLILGKQKSRLEPFQLQLQLHAYKPGKTKGIRVDREEYAKIMSACRTYLTKDEIKAKLFHRCTDKFIYLVEVYVNEDDGYDFKLLERELLE